MTADEIRKAINWMERNYALALDADDHGLADAFQSKIDYLLNQLVAKIQAEDPYATEADIRYFEGV